MGAVFQEEGLPADHGFAEDSRCKLPPGNPAPIGSGYFWFLDEAVQQYVKLQQEDCEQRIQAFGKNDAKTLMVRRETNQRAERVDMAALITPLDLIAIPRPDIYQSSFFKKKNCWDEVCTRVAESLRRLQPKPIEADKHDQLADTFG